MESSLREPFFGRRERISRTVAARKAIPGRDPSPGWTVPGIGMTPLLETEKSTLPKDEPSTAVRMLCRCYNSKQCPSPSA
jgi:hypothetical protein